MKEISITVDTATLSKQLLWVNRFVETKTTIPILGHVLMRLHPDGGLILSGTDLEIAGTTSVNIPQMGHDFALTVPMKPLIKALPSFKGVPTLALTFMDAVTMTKGPNPDKKDEQIDIETHAYSLSVSDGTSTVKYEGMSAETYPTIPTVDDSLCRIGGDIPTFLRRAVVAVSQEETRFTLNGALLLLTPKGPDALVSTDGHRLSLQYIPTDYAGAKDDRTLIPRRTLEHLIHTYENGHADGLTLRKNEYHIATTIDTRTIVSRKLTGNFPDHERVLPKEFIYTVTLGTERFLIGAREVALLVKDESENGGNHPCRLTIAPETEESEPTFTISGKSESGKVSAQCPFEMDKKPIEFEAGYNVEYLIDAAALMPEKFEYAFSAKDKAAELRAPEEGWRYVIMPHRI